MMSGPMPAPRPHILALAPYPLSERSGTGGGRPILLAQNENAAPPCPAAIEAAQAAMADLNRYPEGDAASLRHAIAAAENISADRIICGAGSMELISLLAQAYLGPGDEMVVSEHGYLFFRTVAESVGARFVLAPERRLCVEVDAMLRQVGPRTRMVCLANPNNPTGTLLSSSEIRRLRASLRPDIILVLDGAYAEYVNRPDYDPGIELVETTANTVMVRTFSKVHGLASLRIGWGYFPHAIADIINRIRHPNNVAAPGLAAAAAAIADRGHAEKIREANAELLAWLTRELRQLGLSPDDSHGNFLLLPFGSPQNAATAYLFLKARDIMLRPMSAYGLGDRLRVTIGSHDELLVLRDALRVWTSRH
jgi:histidinol-phosphate aminotransferase